MFPQSEIDDFRKYWRRRKPGSSTAVHYTSDVRIFFKWIEGRSPEAITVHDVDRFIVWQQSRGHAPAIVTRRLIALRMFYDYLAYARDRALANPVVPPRHYVDRGRRLPRNLNEEVIQRLFAAIGEHPRDRAIFTLMLHAGLRVGEVVELGASQVDLTTARTPHLRLTGKSQRERIVYLSATAALYLREYLARDDHAIGLTRLLTLAARVLAVVEYAARRKLQATHRELTGLYPGQPTRSTAQPTTERLLKAFDQIALVTIRTGRRVQRYLTPLTHLQKEILRLLDSPAKLYQQLALGSG